MNKFELPTNADVEKIMETNLKNTKPLEMKEKYVNGTRSLFPFWKPVKSEGAEVFYDYKSYLSKKEHTIRTSQDNNIGVVKPKSTFKSDVNGTSEINDTYEDNTIIGKMSNLVNKLHNTELGDNSGVVKSHSTFTSSNKTTPSTTKVEQNNLKEISHADTPKSDKVGVVKPHNAFNSSNSHIDFNRFMD